HCVAGSFVQRELHMADPSPSSALIFFDSIRNAPDPVVAIRKQISPKPIEWESEYLDYKSGNAKEDDVKRLWAEALSGFANGGGGVIIWGLDCRKDANGVNTVVGETLIQNPDKFKTRLMELQLNAVQPPVLGVEIVPYSADQATGAGFVVCHIPS